MSRPFSPLPDSRPPAVLTVSELNEIIRNRLETGIDALWVTGELSNVRFPPSGHVYFTLKDRQSQISAVLFRRHAESLRFRLEDGMEVVCSGRVSLYTVRGALQFYAVEVEARGKGALAVAFEQLKQRLSGEGLFDAERKKPLPFLPRTVGIVTSLHGAAVRDMLSIIGERFPDRRVVIRPVRVQGDGAAEEIAAGIRELDATGAVDVMIVGRGGGSLEDLWAFNEEVVARAIASARVPVVSAVGHEIDVTIADFVADQRAATPTAAAEMVVPIGRELAHQVAALARRLRRGTESRLERRRENLRHWVRRLADPGQRLRQGQMRLDDLSLRLWRRQEDRSVAPQGAPGPPRRTSGRGGSAGGLEARLQHRVPGLRRQYREGCFVASKRPSRAGGLRRRTGDLPGGGGGGVDRRSAGPERISGGSGCLRKTRGRTTGASRSVSKPSRRWWNALKAES